MKTNLIQFPARNPAPSWEDVTPHACRIAGIESMSFCYDVNRPREVIAVESGLAYGMRGVYRREAYSMAELLYTVL